MMHNKSATAINAKFICTSDAGIIGTHLIFIASIQESIFSSVISGSVISSNKSLFDNVSTLSLLEKYSIKISA